MVTWSPLIRVGSAEPHLLIDLDDADDFASFIF